MCMQQTTAYEISLLAAICPRYLPIACFFSPLLPFALLLPPSSLRASSHAFIRYRDR